MKKITKEMTIEDILEKYPKTIGIFMEFKIPCLVCGEPLWGTVEEIARRYNVDLDKLLASLNKYIGNV
jgi:hybrid cluster-associated redox disulfide protein